MNARARTFPAARRLRDRRGAVLVVAAASMAGVLGTVALAVDVGLLYTARGEAQKAADAAALAGAESFLQAPLDGAAAAALAGEVGELNAVRNEPVEIELAAERVTVTIRRLAGRGNPVPTHFARVFGVTAVDVEATATAEAVTVGRAGCPKPFAPPDAFHDVNGNGKFDPADRYETPVTGYGSAYRDGEPSDNGVDPRGTTYVRDFGRPVILKEGNPNDQLTPSQFFPITLPEEGGGFSQGADDYREAIAGCHPAAIAVGDVIPTEPGNMTGPTKQGLQDLIALDPGARWDVGARAVQGSRYSSWRSRPRIIHLPLFDPTRAPSSGRKEIHVANVTAFWVEGLRGKDVVGRFLFASGVPGGQAGPGGPGAGPALKAVRLVR